jgi:lipopolysaccharide transport system ATP-binding protein
MSCEESAMSPSLKPGEALQKTNADEPIIKVNNLGKRYCIYDKPLDRLKQALWRDRRKYYREFWALRNISFEINRGETIGVIGRNGSGKSTLLQLICKTLEPSEGSVLAEGRVAALLELGSGFNPEFSGLENVYMNATLLGLEKVEIERHLDSILSFADIGDFINQPVKSYSSGMQLRLAFAVLAHVNADILICDEALAVGDAVFTQRCMRFIKKFQESGTLLFVSHDPNSVAALTERCIWINKGSLVYDGKTRTGLHKYSDYCQEESGFRTKSNKSNQLEASKSATLATSVNKSSSHKGNRNPTANHNLILENSVRAESTQGWEAFIRQSVEDIVPSLEESKSIGHCDGLAIITGWKIIDEKIGETSIPSGGATVDIVIRCKALSILLSPLVGFQVVDRRGQILFGDNTYDDSKGEPVTIPANVEFFAAFRIIWPFLAPGEYTINLAVSTGNFAIHLNHHWINEAIIITAIESTRKVNGLFAPSIEKKKLSELN